MTRWDQRAAETLHRCAARLRDRGVIDWLHTSTRAMWEPNAARYEPSELLDTSRGIATMAMENLRERLLADYRATDSTWRQRGVRLSIPQGSLLIQVGDTNLHIVKARGVHIHEPTWSEFNWDASLTRRAAASRNSTVYDPAPPTPPSQLALPMPAGADGGHARGLLREVFVVWAGDSTGRTAGWVGFPCLNQERWLAVQPVWRDDVSARAAVPDLAVPRVDGPSFNERPAPEAVVALKRGKGKVQP
jgi:hypothetical protein